MLNTISHFNLNHKPISTKNKNIFPTLPQQRGLKLFNNPRPEIVIGNYSAIFGMLVTYVRHRMKYPNENVHPDLTLIIPQFWMDNISKWPGSPVIMI